MLRVSQPRARVASRAVVEDPGVGGARAKPRSNARLAEGLEGTPTRANRARGWPGCTSSPAPTRLRASRGSRVSGTPLDVSVAPGVRAARRHGSGPPRNAPAPTAPVVAHSLGPSFMRPEGACPELGQSREGEVGASTRRALALGSTHDTASVPPQPLPPRESGYSPSAVITFTLVTGPRGVSVSSGNPINLGSGHSSVGSVTTCRALSSPLT
jgi:hypothetical protein